MIQYLDANLLEHPLDGFIHSCNCFHTMGGGIALRIRKKYPELYEADLMHGKSGDRNRLGTFSTVKCHDDKQGYNLYGQYDFGSLKRHTNYEAIYTGLSSINSHAIDNNVKILGLPQNMGCVLGGGSWQVVDAMINDIFLDSPTQLLVCNYQG